jgi:serine/threonine protein kinase
MATPTTSVRDYCALIAKSRLVPAEEVDRLHAKWRGESNHTDDRVDSFRKFLVGRRILTEYQAALIQRGRADNFFLGGYKILDRIGKGQMGGVYRAAHDLGQVVALKILPASRARDTRVLGRFQREARLLIQLDHPNVVRAFQLGDANGVHYIVMEYLEGETLDEVLTRRKRLPWGEAVRVIQQTLNGLQHLHERRMVHRDLKPANLMLTPAADKPDTTFHATVKILDIGLGRALFDDDMAEGQIDTQLTAEGAVLGTPDYLAPEQARDARGADVRADIYSIGCVLYHCLTGQPPFPETNIMAQMLRHATEKPAPLTAFLSGPPAGLQAVLDRMLAKSPDDRYATPAEASAALTPFLTGSGTIPKSATLVPEFKAWLETESQMELPKDFPDASAKPGTQPTTRFKDGTASSPAASKPAATSVGTAPAAPLIAKAGTAPAVPARPAPKPAPVDVVDVELVPEPAPVFVPTAPQIQIVKVPEARRPWDINPQRFDRRDWLMLAAGAASVLAAVGVGYGLARLVRKKPDESSSEDG